MSKVVYYAAASLDGYIAEADDNIDWLTGYQGSFKGPDARPMKGSYDAFYDGIGAIVSGSTTYEWLLGHMDRTGNEWPYKGKPTWVLSSRELKKPQGDDVDVKIVNAKVRDIHDELTSAAGERDLWVLGGGNVASQYAGEGLLDVVHVTLVPVVLGGGKPLFERRLEGGPMQLTEAHPWDSGMVNLRYEVAR